MNVFFSLVAITLTWFVVLGPILASPLSENVPMTPSSNSSDLNSTSITTTISPDVNSTAVPLTEVPLSKNDTSITTLATEISTPTTTETTTTVTTTTTHKPHKHTHTHVAHKPKGSHKDDDITELMKIADNL